MRLRWHRHVLKNLLLVPDVVARSNHVRAKIENLLSNGRRNAETAGRVLSIHNKQIDSVRLKHMGQMFTDNMAAGRAKNVADEKYVHKVSLSRRRRYLKEMIDLVWNFPLLPAQQQLWSRYLTKAMEEYVAEPVEHLRPSFRTVDGSLRARAARLLGFPVERTWLTCGGHHGTLVALMASGLAGERVIVEGNSYPGFLNQCRFTKTELVPCAIDDVGIILADLRALCESASADARPIKGIFLMPTVQNPLGFVTPLDRRQQIVEIAREFELTIIEDDAYGYMEPNPPPNYAELAPERAFYVRGLAKSFAPGARTGFLVAPEGASPALTTAFVCTATGTAVPQNMAGLAMMEDGTLDKLMEEKRAEGAARNAAARDILRAAGLDVAPGAACAWHLWVRLDASIDTRELEKTMADQGVLVSSGHYSAGGWGYGLGVRLALGAEIERAQTLEGVRRLAEVLRAG